MTAPQENKRIVVAFLAGWISATVFAAVVSRGVPAIDAIIALAVMTVLFPAAGFVYNRFTQGKAPGEGEALAQGATAAQPPAAPTREQRCSAYAKKHGLTPRQGEVCLLLVEGKSVNEIAEELYISKDTVKTHVKALYARTDAHSRQELVAAVYGHED